MAPFARAEHACTALRRMKYLPGLLAALIATREMRANLASLLRYLAVLAAMIAVYTVVFHLVADHENQSHSWLTGLYWVLVVMTTTGFGDITFDSDIGRAFTGLVLVSGVVFLLVMLPFQFIRLFYAPWLEARMRSRTPRSLPASTRGHIVIASNDAIVPGLLRRLRADADPYVLIEPDAEEAARLMDEGLSVITGPVDAAETYRAARATSAQMVVANVEDTINTNITLTVRELSEDVPVLAIVENDDSIDVLELSGATHVIPLKRLLGEHLANRSHTHREAHVVGSYRDLQIAELPAREGRLAGLAVRDTHLRGRAGVNIAGVWSRGQLEQAQPDTVIGESDVVVVTGTAEHLDAVFGDGRPEAHVHRPALVLGGGRVGRAAAAFLHSRGVPTHVVERGEGNRDRLAKIADRVVIGDAADRAVLERAGLADASSVVLTTNDDATNIYLAVYCRRLNPGLRIVSRVTEEQNVEAIHRAGADFALSYASLGAETIFSHIKGHDVVTIGEGVDLFTRIVPDSLSGKTLQESALGTRTGLCLVAIQTETGLITELHRETLLPPGAELVMIGTVDQRRLFTREYGGPAGA